MKAVCRWLLINRSDLRVKDVRNLMIREKCCKNDNHEGYKGYSYKSGSEDKKGYYAFYAGRWLVSGVAAVGLLNPDSTSYFLGHKLENEDDLKKKLHVSKDSVKLTKKEIMFLAFASCEYDEVIYMTPDDFLDCLTRQHPHERVFRRVLDESKVMEMLKATPNFSEKETNMFRTLGSNGIISYAEFLFLLTLLTKTLAGFRIAFALFDEDDNDIIDKREFLLVRSLVTPLRTRSRKQEEMTEYNFDHCALDAENINDIINLIEGSVDKKDETKISKEIEYKKSDHQIKVQETTISKYLFGQRGNQMRSFNDFKTFFEQLQKELTEIEFSEFSRGKDFILPADFARLVLRYSNLHPIDEKEYLNRIHKRTSPGDAGISLAEFHKFSLFINNLDNFIKAVRLYTNGEIPVSEEEFIRAVQAATSLQLSSNLVHIIFSIFDENGDGCLTYSEFIAVMNDRLNRGFKKRRGGSKGVGWGYFKDCVINEVSRN
uniref:Calcium uptake protein 3, mitochondrial n=1 Tax=Rhabditophanes sp. KR3021 TaxID=114890 RepID=A0AC35TPM1_9BILA